MSAELWVPNVDEIIQKEWDMSITPCIHHLHTQHDNINLQDECKPWNTDLPTDQYRKSFDIVKLVGY